MKSHSHVPASVVAVLSMPPGEFPIFAADASPEAAIAAHRERQAALMDASQAILARADAEGRDMTNAERAEVEGLTAEFDELQREVELRERFMQQNAILTAPRGRQVSPDPVGDEAPVRNAASAPAPRVPAQPAVRAGGNGGFRHFGEFANAVRIGAQRGGDLDPRLRNAAASTYANEGSGVDGGFAVPPDFRSEILSKVFSEDSLIARTDRLQSSSNTITLPTDETTPWQSSGGIQSYWTAEAAARTQSKPVLGETTLKLHTLATLVPVTQELLEDAPAMGAYLGRKAPEKMDFKLSDAIIRGTGVGQPLGILNSPALVTQAKEGAQTADTINVTNLVKMLSRLPTASRRNAVWLIHPDAEPQLPLMTVGQQPVYMMPGNGATQAWYGTLFGRPVIPHQVCETVGDLGDIMLVDFSQYLSAIKTGNGYDASGIRADSSMHLWFDQDIMAFKFTMRVAGQPWWASTIAQRDGSNTQSPFVVLEAR